MRETGLASGLPLAGIDQDATDEKEYRDREYVDTGSLQPAKLTAFFRGLLESDVGAFGIAFAFDVGFLLFASFSFAASCSWKSDIRLDMLQKNGREDSSSQTISQ